MEIYFNKLFTLMSRKHILQADIVRECGVGQSSFTRMRAGQAVTLNVLQRICEYLECDIGDIVSFKNPYEGTAIDFTDKSNADKVIMIIKSSLEKFMRENDYTTNVISKMSSVSLNTVKAVLVGTMVSVATYQKLLTNLGSDFTRIVAEYWAQYNK